MKTIFLKELRRTRTSLVIWSILIGLLAGFGMMEYPVIGQYTDTVSEVLTLIPKVGQLVFGVYHVNLNDPIGYYVVMYYWTGLLVFVHAIYMGASIVAKESRDRTAEFIFTKPCPRSTIISAKLLAALVNILVVAVAAMSLSMLAMLPITGEPALYWKIVLSSIGMFLTQCVLLAIGVLCSALCKTYRSGITAAMVCLALSYILMFTVQFFERPQLNFLSPLTYFGVSDVVSAGVSLPYAALAAAVAAFCVYAAQKIYASKEVLV